MNIGSASLESARLSGFETVKSAVELFRDSQGLHNLYITYSMVLKQGVLGGGFWVTLPLEMLTVTRDDQLADRRHGTVYCLIFGFAICVLGTFPMGCVGCEGCVGKFMCGSRD